MAPRSDRSRLAQLEARLALLEAQARPAGPRRAGGAAARAQDPVDYARRLAERAGPRFRRGTARGALGYAGALSVDERRYLWARETGAAELLDADAPTLARWLGAIASPPRLRLLLGLLGRDRTSTELAALLGDPSPGQVYHHLKELQAAHILVQVRRGVYRIAPPVLIPLLVVLAGALDASGTTGTDAGEPFPTLTTGRDSWTSASS